MQPDATETPKLEPVRRLNAHERRVWEAVLTQFAHLDAGDAELLTAYAEATARYQTAAREVKKNPTIRVPVVNRSTGNITGHREQRNPAAITLRESLAQMTSLARRLMIDSASAAKRQRLLTAKSRALRASELAQAADQDGFSDAEIEAELNALSQTGWFTRNDPAVNRAGAIDNLRIRREIHDVQTECPDLFV